VIFGGHVSDGPTLRLVMTHDVTDCGSLYPLIIFCRSETGALGRLPCTTFRHVGSERQMRTRSFEKSSGVRYARWE